VGYSSDLLEGHISSILEDVVIRVAHAA
jgi:hypothetical protein